MLKPRREPPAGLAACGYARPALPVSVFAEDFSLLVRRPKRLRIARGRIVLHNCSTAP